MINKHKLYNNLLGVFIVGQYRLDFPMLVPEDNKDIMLTHYHTNPIFKAKVNNIITGVMQAVQKTEEEDSNG